MDGDFMFSIYIASLDETNETMSITGARLYVINLGAKNADGTYPITIEKLTDVNIGGSGGGSGASLLNLRDLNSDKAKVRTSITEEE